MGKLMSCFMSFSEHTDYRECEVTVARDVSTYATDQLPSSEIGL